MKASRRAFGRLAGLTGGSVAVVLCLLLSGCGSGGGTSISSVRRGTQGPGAQSTSSASTHAHSKPTRPNIVFVLTDDLSWNLLRYMPHVLAMEREGESFSHYFVTDSLCCPSRASILTGRFPHNTKVFSNNAPNGGFVLFHDRGEELDTFATSLQSQGYRTALMGKYLNGYQPDDVEEGKHELYVPPGWSQWDVAGDGYPEFHYNMNSDRHLSRYGGAPKEYLTDVLASKSLSFIDSSARRHVPFMLEIATFAPHAPFVPAPRDEGDFPGLKAPRDPAFDAANINAPAWLAHFKALTGSQIETLDRQFRRRAQSVQAVDEMIGNIEHELSARGLAKNTYIVFSSDNGLHMGEHRLLAGKLTAFDSDIRVPLIVVGPSVPHGRTVSAMTENIDLCPTFDQLGGAPVPSSVDGHSLVTLLHGRRASDWRKEILVEHRGPDITPGDPDLPTKGSGNPPSYEAIRTASSLYVEYADGEREYYDLRTDPFELRNIAGDLSAEHVRLLHRTLERIAHCQGAARCWRAEHGATEL
jgi:N-acetylglucosamine-6-sulfatase